MERQGMAISAYMETKNNAEQLTGIIGRKHRLAMARAAELLQADQQTHSIYDSLNCGKLSRLACYLKNGAVYTLAYYTYVQCMVN